MKIKTSELTGAALDWAVTKAEGALYPLGNVMLVEGKWLLITVGGDPDHGGSRVYFRPSADWSQAGPIIEWENIGHQKMEGETVYQAWMGTCIEYAAWPDGSSYAEGPTPLVAAMRCYVASKLGGEVEIPDELTPVN